MGLGTTDGRQRDLGRVTVVDVVYLDNVKGRDGEDLRPVPVAVVVEDRAAWLKNTMLQNEGTST